MKSYATKHEGNLNIVTLHLQGESAIFLADTYMVDVVLAEDLLITTLRYQRIKAGPGARPEGIHLRAEIAPAAR